MNKRRISDIIDTALLAAVALYLGCVIAGYFVRGAGLVLLCGGMISLSVTGLVLNLKKRRKPDIEKSEFTAVFFQFFCGGAEFSETAVFEAFQKRYSLLKREGYFICNDKAVFVYFKPEPLSLAALFALYARADKSEIEQIVILTAEGAAGNALKTASSLPCAVSILNGEDSFRTLRALDALPEIRVAPKKRESGIKYFLRQALSPAHAKRYLFTALFFIGSSLLFPMSVYYIVCGTVCLMLATLAKINITAIKTKK